MSLRTETGDWDELAWIRLYADLSGTTEREARSVFMYVACKETVDNESHSHVNGAIPDPARASER
jgi:hypothetical protein